MRRLVIGTPSLVLLLLARASAQQCGSAGSQCSFWQGCCEDLKCQQKGFLNWRCIEQCVQEGETCGSPGTEDKTCCDGMQCERHLLSTDNKQWLGTRQARPHHFRSARARGRLVVALAFWIRHAVMGCSARGICLAPTTSSALVR